MPAASKPMQLLPKINLGRTLSKVMTGDQFKVAYALLLHFHNSQTGSCFPSYRQLAEASGTSRATACAAINTLKKLGVVDFDPSNGGRNKRNSYSINVQGAERLMEQTFSQPNTRVQPAEHKCSPSRNAYINEVINEEINAPNGARTHASPAGECEVDEVRLYRLGKELLGKSSVGLIKKLEKARGTAGALKLVEMAKGKADPRGWLAAAMHGDQKLQEAEDNLYASVRW